MEYLDNIVYEENIVEYAFRGTSIEYNSYSSRIYGVRVVDKGCIGIASSTSVYDFRQLEELAKKNTGVCIERVKWFNRDYSSGKYRVGRDVDLNILVNELVPGMVKSFRSHGLKAEIILVKKRIKKEIAVKTHNIYNVEERILYELYIYPYTLYLGRLLSTGSLVASPDPRNMYSLGSSESEKLLSILASQAHARRLNPVYTGRWHVILDDEAAPMFYHELAHLLQADEPIKLHYNTVLYQGLTVIEDPFYPGPLQRFFDDELYPAWRRTIIDKGVVVDYLHTRTTCMEKQGGRPGNARGLFTRSKPLYHQLVVKKGDWSLNEMLVESRRSILVRKLVEASLQGRYIRLVPEEAWVAEKDKLTPVHVTEILVPLDKLGEVITGLAKKVNKRYGFERNHSLFEVAPTTLIEARVI